MHVYIFFCFFIFLQSFVLSIFIKVKKEPGYYEEWGGSDTDYYQDPFGDNYYNTGYMSPYGFVPFNNNWSPQISYQSPQNNYQSHQMNYQSPQNNYQSSQMNYLSPQNNYQSSQINNQIPQNNYQSSQINYQSPQNNYQSSQNNYQSSQFNYQSPQNNYQNSQINYQQTSTKIPQSYQNPVIYSQYLVKDSSSYKHPEKTYSQYPVTFSQYPVTYSQSTTITTSTTTTTTTTTMTTTTTSTTTTTTTSTTTTTEETFIRKMTTPLSIEDTTLRNALNTVASEVTEASMDDIVSTIIVEDEFTTISLLNETPIDTAEIYANETDDEIDNTDVLTVTEKPSDDIVVEPDFDQDTGL